MMPISILLPTTRPEGVQMVLDCLDRQTYTDWELLISLPAKSTVSLRSANLRKITFLTDPPRNPGDFYGLNKAWNQLVFFARHDHLIFAVDWIWFEPDTLARFAAHYKANPNVGVNGVGHHYRHITNGKPTLEWEWDRRDSMLRSRGLRDDQLPPELMEFALASLSRSKIIEVGGLDPAYDQGAGMSEKELCCRLAANGYSFVYDRTIRHRNWTHPKSSTTKEWDAAYLKALWLFRDAIQSGSRKSIPPIGPENHAASPSV